MTKLRILLAIGLLSTAFLAAATPVAACVDTDGDGVCDDKDGDDDNDGVKDSCDPNPRNTSDVSRWSDWATYKVRGCARVAHAVDSAETAEVAHLRSPIVA